MNGPQPFCLLPLSIGIGIFGTRRQNTDGYSQRHQRCKDPLAQEREPKREQTRAKTSVGHPFISGQSKRFFTQHILQLTVTCFSEERVDIDLNKTLIMFIHYLKLANDPLCNVLNPTLLWVVTIWQSLVDQRINQTGRLALLA